jgi:hypothetical protein
MSFSLLNIVEPASKVASVAIVAGYGIIRLYYWSKCKKDEKEDTEAVVQDGKKCIYKNAVIVGSSLLLNADAIFFALGKWDTVVCSFCKLY